MASVFLIKLDFANKQTEVSEPIYLSSGQSDISYNGNTYVGGYTEIKESVKETGELSTRGFKLPLSAADNLFISAFTSRLYRNRQMLILKAEIDSNLNVISIEPFVDLDMADYSFVGSDTQKRIVVNTISGTAQLNTLTGVDLGVLYAEHINDDQTVYWGAERPSVGLTTYKNNLTNNGLLEEP